MKHKPILFSAPMVNAIIEGKKTQTRRVIKDPIKFASKHNITVEDVYKYELFLKSSPYGEKGDRLWVRETFRSALSDSHQCWAYRADNKCKCGADAQSLPTTTWKPSIFMPRDACRIELDILGLRVERLQNINEEDAIAEGVEYGIKTDYPIQSFKTLWISINGVNSWQSNPYVWVVNFKKT